MAVPGASDIDGAADGDGMTELSPLDVLLGLMRGAWRDGKHDAAAALAKAAAPYVHGKAASGRVGGDLAGVSDEELEKWRDIGDPVAGEDPEGPE